MRKMNILTLMAVLAVCLNASGLTPPPPGYEKDQKEKKQIAAVVNGGNEFAFDLYTKLAADNKGNLFFSPASIHTALAMTYAGAKGTTAEQMARTLHYTLKDDELPPAFALFIKKLNTPRMDREDKPVYQLTIANALWGQQGYPWLEEFLKVTKDNYGASLQELDFKTQAEESRKTINKWVEEQTKEKIKNLIPEGVLDETTRLVLTNAIYFKSCWHEQFKKENTKDESFNLTAEKKVDVPMMHQKGNVAYMETDDFQAVQLIYQYGDLAMFIFLPKKIDGLAGMEKQLTAENLKEWSVNKMKTAEVELSMPRFKIESSFSLGDTLKAMGMPDAFDKKLADFTGMCADAKKDQLRISQVIHKAFVAVDEEGTEAAAATAVVMVGATAVKPKLESKIFKADHPFVFVIRHRDTGSVLFIGRVMNPKGE